MRISGAYAPGILDALERLPAAPPPSAPRGVALRLGDLQPGMILVDDLKTSDGRCLVTRGNALAEILLERLRQFPESALQEPVWVLPPRANGGTALD